MAAFNLTSSDMSTFILTGIPGLEHAHVWISLPFATCYIIGLLGNFSIVFIVGKEQTLHQPVYLLVCMLALTDIGMSTSIVPKALCIFWFNLDIITVSGCFTQITFLSMVSAMHSAVLVTMAFDRYVAICNPLRYTTILSNVRIATLGMVSLIRGILCALPVPLMLSQLPFCGNRIIPHTFCETMAVAKISCGDVTFFRLYGLVMGIVLSGLDLTLIALSYCLIIRVILSISSKKAHLKALNTCTAHICVMLTAYTPSFFSNLTHRFGQGIAPHVHIILANVYVLAPPLLNPIIYGVKTQELREKMKKNICRM
ncbi:olfactory receptor 52N4-like [Pelodiscus sinensis]|uniref:olfactory receptor 52N4-like n=1 Tax=Pelodiscus sinensis TaxID=13735 RepID=UPI003F6AA64A